MTVTTGSGNYVALMAAVLAHAVTDGWTTTVGAWPISKGNVLGVDWTTYTASEPDRTLLGGANKTARYIRLSVGTTPAIATTNAGANITSALLPNMEYVMTGWTIYSDPLLVDYIHVVINFSNGVNGDCYGHFGFGELDPHGMTHTAVYYATASPKRAYSTNATVGNFSDDSKLGPASRNNHGYSGSGAAHTSKLDLGNSIVYIVDGTVSPLPASGWPAVDTIQDNALVLDTLSTHHTTFANEDPIRRADGSQLSYHWNAWANFTSPQPYSGSVTMGSLPFIILQGAVVNTSTGMFLGSFPNVRCCSMNLYTAGDIVTYASDDWVLYPWLRDTDWSLIKTIDAVTSGKSGYAHKKVI